LEISDFGMSIVHPSDPDLRICLVDFNTLIENQLDAVRLGFATRWTSVDAFRGQAKNRIAVLQTLMREKRARLYHYRGISAGEAR
jgi:hypothetical protein